MRKIYLLLLAACFATVANAQTISATTYAFTNSTGASLEDLSVGATQLVASNSDDATSPVFSIGFDFWHTGVRYSQFSANANGLVRLGGTAVGTGFGNAMSSAVSGNIFPYWDDLYTGTNGQVRYKLLGVAPNRKLVIEWQNMQVPRVGAGNSGAGNFQLWLFETTGVIEFVYGAGIALNTTNAGASIGLANSTTVYANVTSTVPSCAYGVENNANTAAIASGTKYTFTPLVPAAPSGINFTAVTQTGMTVNWTDNATNEIGYAVYRSDDGGTTYNFITQAAANAVTSAQTGLLPGTTYFWRIYAVTEGALSSSLNGSQATNAGGVKTSAASGLWSAPATWSPAGVPVAGDDVIIADGTTVTIDITTAVCNNLTVGQGASGVLQYQATPLAGLLVNGNVTVAAGAIFTAGAGTLTTHTLGIGGTATTVSSGSLINNGTFDMNTTAGVTTTFFGNINGSISGTGATTDFWATVVNKGTTQTGAMMDVTSVITTNSPTASASRLTITAGTYRMSSASVLAPYFGSQTICSANGRLWLNNAGATIQCVGAGTSATGAGSPTVTGELRIDNGTFAYGQGNNTMTVSTGTGVINMSGGTLNMFGAISFASNVGCQLLMSGGNINVDPQNITNLAAGTALFTIGALTTVNWSGGTITIIDPHNAVGGIAWTATAGGVKAVSGTATLRIGDGVSTTASTAGNTSGFGLLSTMALQNLIINNRTDASTTRMARMTGQVAVQGTLTTLANSYLFMGSATTGQLLVLSGGSASFVHGGTLAGCEPAGTQSIGTLYSSATSGAQTLSGGGTFVNVSVVSIDNNGGSLTLSNTNPFKVRRVNMFTGSFTPGANFVVGNNTTATGLENPIIQYGSGNVALAAGTFTTFPTLDETEAQRSLIYSIASNTFTMGFNGESSPGDQTLTSLLVNNANGLSIPADRTITLGGLAAGTLTMTLGSINLNGGNLILGNAAATPGTLAYTAGFIQNGTFTRWFPTAALPTAFATGNAGHFPMGDNGNNRTLFLNFSTATALTTGGTISVSHTNGSGTTAIPAFVDGAVTVDSRTNASWTISQSGCVLGAATINARIQGSNISGLFFSTLANLRFIRATDAVATSSNGTNTIADPQINRTAMNLTDLANTFYFGLNSADIPFISVTNGNWEDGTTWNKNPLTPTAADAVTIANATTVTVNAVPAAALNVTVNSGGTLTVSGNTLAVTGALGNNGTVNASGGTLNVTAAATTGITNGATTGVFNVNGGTVNLGVTDNTACNRTFSNSGTLNVSSGALNIYGNIVSNAGGIFNQSGGNINVDGNAGGNAANSVASGLAIVQLNPTALANINLTGGTFTIVDPHANTTLSSAFSMSTSATGTVSATAGHTFRLGDGVSTDAGGNVGGFNYNPWVTTGGMRWGNIILNGPAGTNRAFVQPTTFGALFCIGNLTINSGASLVQNGTATTSAIAVGGDVTVNAGGSLTTLGLMLIGNGVYTSGTTIATTPSAIPQSITNTGTIQNLAASPTANFTSMQVNNTNATGVTLASPLSVSGTLTMTSGLINTTTVNILQLGTAAAAGTLSGTPSTTNMIVGPFARTFAASRTATGTYTATTLYPVGKGASYLPIHIDPSTTAGGAVIMNGEAFTTNSGTQGSGVTSLSTNRWEALITSGAGNFTNSFIRLNDAGIVSTNKILQAPSAAGAYTGVPVASTYAAGTPNTLTTASAITAANYTGYFAYGDLTNCVAPTDQPTGFGSSNLTTTSFTGNFTLAASTPSHYLVVLYPAGSAVTAPVDYTSYAPGAALGLGTVVANVTSPAATYNATGLTAATTYDIYIYSYNNSACFGPVYYTVSPLQGSVTTCAAATGTPGTPTSSLITSTSFTASWTASSTPGVDYVLDVATDAGFTSFVAGYNGLNVGTGTLSYNITGLTANTTYYVRVRAVITGCFSSNSGTLTVTTDCTPFTPAYLQDFTTYVPSCWKEQTGYLTVAPSSLTGTSSAWIADGWLNSGSTGAAKINLFTTGKRDWLISPSIDLGISGNYQLEFDLATLTFAGTSASILGADDSLAVVISTDNGATWSTTNILSVWTAANTPVSASGLHVTIPLTSYTGTVKFGFYGSEGAVDNPEDVDVMIDNFAINVQPACPTPSAVSVGSITQTTASVSFTSPGASFIVEYGLSGFTPGTGASPGVGGTIVTGTSSPIGLSGLTPAITYDVYVRRVCAGPSYSVNSPVVTFTTPVIISSFPYCQDFEGITTGWSSAIASGLVNNWVIGTPAKTQIAAAHSGTKAYVTKTTGSYDDNQNAYVLSPTFDFSALTGNPTISFWHNFKTETGWDAGVLEYSTNGGTTWTKLDANLGTGGTFNTTNSTGWYNSSSSSGPVTPPKWSNTSTAYTGHASGWIQSTSLLTAFSGPSYSNVKFRWRFGSDGSGVDEGWAIDDICVELLPPSCPATFTPANNATVCGSASATTLSWTAGTNASGYDVYFDPGAGPATTQVSSNQPGLTYSAGVLAPGTYSWRIVSRGNGTSVCSDLTFTVVAPPTINITPAGPVSICSPATQTLNLGATNASSPTYQWKNNGVNIGGQTGTSYIASASGNYSLTVTDGVTGCSTTSNVVAVTVNPQPGAVTITPSSVTLCTGSSAQLLTASGGGINVTGSPVASSGTTGLDGNPYRTFWDGGKVQFIYTAAELSAAGLSAGMPISSLAFDVTVVGDPLPNFTIEMKHTTAATFSTTTMETGMTTVFSTASPYQPVLGINTHTFSTPFVWNGTDNIVFSTCFGTSATGSSSQVRSVPTVSSSVLQSATDLTTCATATGTTNATRPFIIVSAVLPTNFTWTPNGTGNGLYTDAGATTLYTGGATPTVYTLPSATTTYTATATSAAGCTSSQNVVVTVLPANTLEWTGAINSDWTNAGNWTCNTVPGVTSNVIIKTGVPNFPQVNVNAEIRSLSVQPGATVTVLTGFDLKINN